MSMFFGFAPVAGGAPPGPPGPLGTWSATDKNAGILISGGDTIATMDYNNLWSTFRGNIGKSSGSGYFEVQCPAATGGLQFVGIANASASLTTGAFVGYDNDGIGYFGSGVIYRNLTDLALPVGFDTEYIGVEVDFGTNFVRYYKDTTLVATINISTLSGPIFPAGSLYSVGKTAVINCGQTSFNRTPTSGINPYWCADA